MATDGGDTAHQPASPDDALGEALAELTDAAAPEAVDYRWLGIGLRIGLERPERARHLLELIGRRGQGGVAATLPEAGTSPGDVDAAPADGDAAPAGAAVDDSSGALAVPVRSLLLARAAALPSSAREGLGPEVTFGWVARLTAGEILSIGRVVGEMLAAGSPANVGRGFALTWDAGVRVPSSERNALFREFTALEVTVGGILVGRDLRGPGPAREPRGFAALFGQLVPQSPPENAQAAAALEQRGEPARRGLVALWNAWVAMRYRSRIPQPVFDLLVRPWVTVIGALPDA